MIYGDRPLLLDPMPLGGWYIDWGRELNIHDDRQYFAVDPAGAPLREGSISTSSSMIFPRLLTASFNRKANSPCSGGR